MHRYGLTNTLLGLTHLGLLHFDMMCERAEWKGGSAGRRMAESQNNEKENNPESKAKINKQTNERTNKQKTKTVHCLLFASTYWNHKGLGRLAWKLRVRVPESNLWSGLFFAQKKERLIALRLEWEIRHSCVKHQISDEQNEGKKKTRQKRACFAALGEIYVSVKKKL